jgi:hypothetical protein
MGKQYNILAHLLLVIHDPTIPQLGPSHRQSRQVVDVSTFHSVSNTLLIMVIENGPGGRAYVMRRCSIKSQSVSFQVRSLLRYCTR